MDFILKIYESQYFVVGVFASITLIILILLLVAISRQKRFKQSKKEEIENVAFQESSNFSPLDIVPNETTATSNQTPNFEEIINVSPVSEEPFNFSNEQVIPQEENSFEPIFSLEPESPATIENGKIEEASPLIPEIEPANNLESFSLGSFKEAETFSGPLKQEPPVMELFQEVSSIEQPQVAPEPFNNEFAFEQVEVEPSPLVKDPFDSSFAKPSNLENTSKIGIQNQFSSVYIDTPVVNTKEKTSQAPMSGVIAQTPEDSLFSQVSQAPEANEVKVETPKEEVLSFDLPRVNTTLPEEQKKEDSFVLSKAESPLIQPTQEEMFFDPFQNIEPVGETPSLVSEESKEELIPNNDFFFNPVPETKEEVAPSIDVLEIDNITSKPEFFTGNDKQE